MLHFRKFNYKTVHGVILLDLSSNHVYLCLSLKLFVLVALKECRMYNYDCKLNKNKNIQNIICINIREHIKLLIVTLFKCFMSVESFVFIIMYTKGYFNNLILFFLNK